jgi:hypothetical protein
LPTLYYFELRDIRNRITSQKQKLIFRVESESQRLEEPQLQELLDQLMQQKVQRLRDVLAMLKEFSEDPDEPPFELEPSWFRMPQNEEQLQHMIEMARANFEPKNEP